MITPESPSLETKNENPVVSPASDATFLATWLVDRDTACPLCEYNIRGLTTPRCPECGQALRLSVALAEPYLKAWIALIAGLLPPAGIGTVFIFVFSNELMHEGTRMFGRAGLFQHADWRRLCSAAFGDLRTTIDSGNYLPPAISLLVPRVCKACALLSPGLRW